MKTKQFSLHLLLSISIIFYVTSCNYCNQEKLIQNFTNLKIALDSSQEKIQTILSEEKSHNLDLKRKILNQETDAISQKEILAGYIPSNHSLNKDSSSTKNVCILFSKELKKLHRSIKDLNIYIEEYTATKPPA